MVSRKIKQICIFCGSSSGKDAVYTRKTRAMARALVAAGLDLIYGGGNVGLMGELARTVLELGGRVTGVIPETLYRRVKHVPLSELHIVPDMHQRKAKMSELADAFIAMPGGIGTLEEFFEVYTWLQLRFHRKPVGLYNIAGFFNHLLGLLDHLVEEGFFKPVHRQNLVAGSDPVILLAQLIDFIPAAGEKWKKAPAESVE